MRAGWPLAGLGAAGLLLGAPRLQAAADFPCTRDPQTGIERCLVEGDKPHFFRLLERSTGQPFGPASELPFGRSIALLVGVGKYQRIHRQLPFVAKDLTRLRDYLLGQGGFDEVYVVRDEHVTVSLIENFMMTRFPKQLRPEDRLLFFFSGHGLTAGGVTGYMALGNADPQDLSQDVVPIDRVHEWSKVLGNVAHVLFVLDSCSSGLGLTPKSNPREPVVTLARDGSRAAMSAGTADEETYGTDDGSVFTGAFLKALQGRNVEDAFTGVLTTNEVFASLETTVKEAMANERKNLTPRLWPLQPQDYRGTFLFLNPRAKGPLAADLGSWLRGQTAVVTVDRKEAKAGRSGGKWILPAAAGVAVAGAAVVKLATRGGDGGVTLANARFVPEVIECPRGSIDAPIPFTIVLDAQNTSSQSAALGVLESVLTLRASPANPGEVGQRSSLPARLDPTTLPAKSGAVTLSVTSTLFCDNAAGDETRFNEWAGQVTLAVDGKAQPPLSTQNILRINIR